MQSHTKHYFLKSPKLWIFFFWSSFSFFHWSDFLIRPKYRILRIRYCGHIWKMTRGKVSSLFFGVFLVLYQWNKTKIIEINTGLMTAIPNLGWLPSLLSLSQYGVKFRWIVLYSESIQNVQHEIFLCMCLLIHLPHSKIFEFSSELSPQSLYPSQTYFLGIHFSIADDALHKNPDWLPLSSYSQNLSEKYMSQLLFSCLDWQINEVFLNIL